MTEETIVSERVKTAIRRPHRPETALMRETLVALSAAFRGSGIFWRVNVGAAVTAAGSVMRFGLPGQADIAGCVAGRHVEVEVKTDVGRQSPAQRNWQDAIRRAGGIYVLARSADEAVALVRAALGDR